jgi:hypothetical protein
MIKSKINSLSLSVLGFLWLVYFIYLLSVLISLDQTNFQFFFQYNLFLDVESEAIWLKPWVLFTYSFFHNSIAVIAVHSVLIFLLLQAWEYSLIKTVFIWVAVAVIGGIVFYVCADSGVLIGPSFVISFLASFVFLKNLKKRNKLVFGGFFLFVISFALDITMNGLGISSLLHTIGIVAGLICYLILVFLNMNFLNRLKIWFGMAPNLKVKQKNPRLKSDDEYNQERKMKREYLDFILDKISRSGFESLNKAERKFLDENKE